MFPKKGLFITAAAAALLGLGCSQGGHEEQGGQASRTMEVEISEGGRVVKFEMDAPVIDLVNQDGERVTNEDLKGKVVLINFIYTNCQESCPVMVHKFMNISEEMKNELGRDLLLVSITMDPERDSPEVLKEFAGKMDIDTSKWMFLTGDRDTVGKTLKAFHFYYVKNEDGTFGHANTIILLDRKGKWKYNFSVLTVPVDIVIERVKKELTEAG